MPDCLGMVLPIVTWALPASIGNLENAPKTCVPIGQSEGGSSSFEVPFPGESS